MKKFERFEIGVFHKGRPRIVFYWVLEIDGMYKIVSPNYYLGDDGRYYED